MLRELRIRNFAVIESVAVEFRPGLNVLTGETGAGKSMLIDAILLVLGARAQTDVIRSDADAATVEAVFDVEPRGAVAATLDEAERTRAAERDRAQREDLLRFQLSELDAARLRPGEEEELRQERRRLQHADKLTAGLAEVAALLDDDHESATARLHRATRILGDLARLDSSMAAPVEPIDAARAQLEDALAAVRALRESVLRAPAMERSHFRSWLERAELEGVSPRGLERVEFRLSTNPGEDVRPLARVASGGELSRTMLGLTTVLAKADRVPTMVFDEVDAGIGGRVASVVAQKLAAVAEGRQVLCVTHLAPIAARAGHHVRVTKTVRAGRSRVALEGLAGDARVEEIARMLAGERVTDTARGHARELLGASGPRERRA